jgi:glycosyltransferase involved in cell wall biosynthesis
LKQHLDDFGISGLVDDGRKPSEPTDDPISAKVALTGHWYAASGLGEDIRCTAAALDAADFTEYVIVDFDTKIVLNYQKKEIEASGGLVIEVNIVHRNAETSMDDWLSIYRMGIQAKWTVGHWHWELDRLPSKWIHGFSFYDEIWASSTFAQNAFAAAKKRSVRLLPGAVIPYDISRQVSRKELGLADNSTLFLFVFDVGSYASRKNPQAVLAAFRDAFPVGDEAVELVVKTQNGSKDPALWTELVELCGKDNRIHLLDAKLSRDHLNGLMLSMQAFVSLHRSEGYGRGVLEAMLLGKPVIVTAYSGTNDFADLDCACLVRYTLRPVKVGEYPGVEGQSWADADVGQAAEFMRWVHKNPQQARDLGERARKKIQDTLSPLLIGHKILNLVDVITKMTAVE